jgi:hypothetical protein
MSYTYFYVKPGAKLPYNKVVKRTRGKLVRVTDHCGLMGFRYAVFRNRASEVWVPLHDLTPETKAAVEVFCKQGADELGGDEPP